MLHRFLFSGRAILLLLALTVLCGCARGYDMHLTNGRSIRASSKPKLDSQGWYIFKDGEGKVERVNSLRVRSIEPASRSEKKPFEYR
jgi:hypothetical protein